MRFSEPGSHLGYSSLNRLVCRYLAPAESANTLPLVMFPSIGRQLLRAPVRKAVATILQKPSRRVFVRSSNVLQHDMAAPASCHRQQSASFHASSVHLKKKDYYEVLGVKRGASDSELKRAYLQVSTFYFFSFIFSYVSLPSFFFFGYFFFPPSRFPSFSKLHVLLYCRRYLCLCS